MTASKKAASAANLAAASENHGWRSIGERRGENGGSRRRSAWRKSWRQRRLIGGS
jgi:hypothetical protein